MRTKIKQFGMTLTETTIVVGVMALLTALSLPAVRTFFSSMATAGNTRSLISAALSSGRAIAAKEQRYAGIRFQKAYDPAISVLDAPQYIIFIVNEEPKKMGNLTLGGFRAVEGVQPIKLSDNVGVIDTSLMLISGNAAIDDENKLRNATTFSIVFSPSGKMVIYDVRARNRDGVYQPDNGSGNTEKVSMDDIFNSELNIRVYKTGKFIQDDYKYAGDLPYLDLGEESSRNSFVIYETDKFRQAYNKSKAWSEYLIQLKPFYINPYTGTIVFTD